jgi:hypothetical protein
VSIAVVIKFESLTVTIIATDIADNEPVQLITVSVKVISLSTSIVWSSIGDDDKINGYYHL